MLQTRANGLALMPVLKANAYGHSAEIIAKLCEAHLSEREVPYLLVARVGEARALRRAGVKRSLLVLSEFSGEDLNLDWPANTELVLDSMADVQSLRKASKQVRAVIAGVQLNLDTGMNRLGFRVADRPQLAAELLQIARDLQQLGLRVTGLMTHLARGEEDPTICSNEQAARFVECVTQLRKLWTQDLGDFPRWIHGANSPGVLQHVALGTPFTAVRPGLHLWGVYGAASDPHPVNLRPVAEVRAPLRQMFWVEAGEGVGYGHRFVAPRRTLIGTVSLGYADGVNRALSRAAQAPFKVGFVVAGTKVPVAGTVSMDSTMVDLTDHPQCASWSQSLARGDMPALQATWIGPGQSAEDVAAALGTISYEVLCALAQRLPRRGVKAA
ncbi:MAG: alanine racemase [Bdellovibrionales bacterium]|nr:alanine racemase [Bdellovibrionales bacterium]